MFCNLLSRAIILATVWYFCMPAPAHAYFDLSFANYMWQIILGFSAAGWMSFRHYWAGRRKAKAQVETKESSPAENTVGDQ